MNYNKVLYDHEGDVIMHPEIIVIEDNYESPEIIVIEDTKTKSIPYKKKSIPLPLKCNVWHKWIGKHIGTSVCLCCKINEITQMSFHAGHIIAEKNGGKLTVDNLKPICQSCNSSMKTQNMNEFIKKYNL